MKLVGRIFCCYIVIYGIMTAYIIVKATWCKGGVTMCICNIQAKLGLLRGGESLEGTLHFLFELVLFSSVIRVLINWGFGI